MTRSPILRRAAAPGLALAVSCLAAASVGAQQPASVGNGGSGPSQAASSASDAASARSTAQWLARLQQARNIRAYTGAYEVWSAAGGLTSSRIWHASQGDTRVERVEALSGPQRSVYRVTDQNGSDIETLLPDQRVRRIDHSDTPGKEGGFPNLPDVGRGLSPASYYEARQTGQERVAGFMADVVRFTPRDDLRHGYRVWSERGTGLALKLQTLDAQGQVLEQVAFSDLTLDAPVSAAALLREMRGKQYDGWRVERVRHSPTTARAEGWRIGESSEQPVPGFALQHCYRQPAAEATADAQSKDQPAAAAAPGWFQCVFSDGLAAVSVFVQPYDAARTEHQNELETGWGATHLLARRVGDAGGNMGWATVVGEVPPQTLRRFVQGIARLP